MTPIATLQYEADQARKDAGLSASVTFQGKCVEYKVHGHVTSKVGGIRGEISDFSDAARLRMLKNFHRIDFSLKPFPLFITLTYPDEVATPNLETRNLHRKTFARHLERITGRNVGLAWRVEWQERKTGLLIGTPCPHWHLLVFRVGFIPYEEINRAWKATIGHEGYVRTDIKRVDEQGSIQGYMAKYISKEALPLSLVRCMHISALGRSYGWLRKDAIPWAAKRTENALTPSQRAAMTRFAAERIPQSLPHLEGSWTLLGDAADQAQKDFPKLPLTTDGPAE